MAREWIFQSHWISSLLSSSWLWPLQVWVSTGINLRWGRSWFQSQSFYIVILTFRPDLIDYDALNPSEHIRNLNTAFDVADKRLGLRKILDAEGIVISRTLMYNVKSALWWSGQLFESTTGISGVCHMRDSRWFKTFDI